MEQQETRYKTVRGLTRGLDVLRALSHSEKIDVTVADISRVTALHRTTVQRLLETLIAEGYVRRGEDTGSYRLASGVLELSGGFTEAAWISTVAADAMAAMLEQVAWPSSLSTLADDESMVIRETTHRISRLSFHHGMVGRKIPLLWSAAGRAYVGALQPRARDALLRRLARSDHAQAAFARDKRFITELVTGVLKTGYASNIEYPGVSKNTSALAMPIHHRGKVVASLNIVYLTSAVRYAHAVETFLPPLREAVARIGSLLDESKKLSDV